MTISSIARTALVAALALAAPAVSAAPLPFEIAPTVNLQYDWAHVDADGVSSENDQDFRRARLGVRLQDRDKRWQIVAEHDFSDRTPADLFLALTPADGHAFRFGQFKQPFLLEDAISDKQAAFLETSFLGPFAISRRIGAEYARYADAGTLNVALFGKRMDGTNESLGATVRGTRLLHSSPAGKAHVGMSLASETPDHDTASFSANPGTVLTPRRPVSTGSIAAVQRLDRAAIEGLWIRQAWSLQGELAHVVARRDGEDFQGTASSVQVTWSPTGDGRRYKRGVATAPSFDGTLAWELALRWSSIDLDDGLVGGGEAESYGLAATCYAHRNVRVIANVLKVESTRRGVADNPLVAGLRLQLTY